MLFSNKRQHALTIPAADQDGKPVDIGYLIDHLCQNVMDDSRKDLFVLDNHLYVLATLYLRLCLRIAIHTPLDHGHGRVSLNNTAIHLLPHLRVFVANRGGNQSTGYPGSDQ